MKKITTYKALAAAIKEYTDNDFSSLSASSTNEFSGSCGIAVLAGLKNAGKLDVLLELTDLLSDFGMVLISDTVDSTRWDSTKKFGIKGPIVINPQTGNKIRTWTFTDKEASAIFKSLSKAELKKLNEILEEFTY